MTKAAAPDPLDKRTDHVSPRRKRRGAVADDAGSAFTRSALRKYAGDALRDPATGRGPAVCGCGKASYHAKEVKLYRDGDGRGRAAGTHRCDSLWLCPICTFRRAMEVQERARRFADKAMQAGAWCYIVTLTVRHDPTTPLDDEKKAVAGAFRKAQQGEPYRRLRRRGLIGAFRNMEVKHSTRTGWHLHVHALVPAVASDEASARDLANRLVGRYLTKLRGEGMSAVQDGQDVTLCYDAEGAGQYAAKGAAEVSLNPSKLGNATSRHPFELLALAASGDRQAHRLFIEYAQTMPGTPQGRISDAVVREISRHSGEDPREVAQYLRYGDADDSQDGAEEPQPDSQADEAVATVGRGEWNALAADGTDAVLVQRVQDGASYGELLAEGWPVRPPALHDPPGDDVTADVVERLRTSGTIA